MTVRVAVHMIGPMRFARDKLIFLALCTLKEWQERCRAVPVKPDFGLRVALGVLFAFSRSGEREHYDRFWRNVGNSFPSADTENASTVWRSNEAHCCFEWISRDVGAPQDMDYRAKIGKALHGASEHPRW